jgi:hypothetical protein
MDMTKFENADDPGFKAVVGELRRWVKELARPENARVPQVESSHGDRTIEVAGGRASEQQVLQITQGGPQFGPTTVSGGSIFQGNYVVRNGGIF